MSTAMLTRGTVATRASAGRRSAPAQRPRTAAARAAARRTPAAAADGPRTLYDKIWDDHVVNTSPDGA